MMGSGTLGLGVSAFFLVLNTYGIWKQSLMFYNVPLVPFLCIGLFGMVMFYWCSGFLLERVGLYREFQNHSNQEVNPEWAEVYQRIKKIAKKMDVD